MRNLTLALVLLAFAGCAHMKESCSEYCQRTGGVCKYIENGERRYDTTRGEFTERSTIYTCTYDK